MHSTAKSIASALAFACLAGCAGSKTTPDRLEPASSQPKLAFIWSDQLSTWRYLDQVPQEHSAPSHVPASDELVVATSDGELVKYQASSGKVLWRQRIDSATFHAGVTTGSGRVFAPDLQGRIHAVELATGAPVWSATIGTSMEAPPAYAGGRLFVSNAADVVFALDAATGERIWSHTRPTPEYFTVKGSCAPVVKDDAVLCGFSDGHLLALQIDSGDVIWDADLTGGEKEFTDIDGAVVVDGGRVYAASYGGGVYALDAETGAIEWRSAVASAGDFAVDHEHVYVASAAGRVIALDRSSGQAQWSFKFRHALPSSLVTYGPYLLVASSDGPLYVLDSTSGYLHLKWRGTSGFHASLSKGSSRVYALSNAGRLFTLKLGY